MRVKVGINGFGRIGRALFRIMRQDNRFDVVVVNDIDPNVENHAYLVKFDSHYGWLREEVKGSNAEMRLYIDNHQIPFYAKNDIAEVPWQEHGVHVVVDASGVTKNLLSARSMIVDKRVPKVVVTHSPSEGADNTIVFGVNEDSYDRERHHVVSASICDVMSSAVVLN